VVPAECNRLYCVGQGTEQWNKVITGNEEVGQTDT
jgi:hypothetical protein